MTETITLYAQPYHLSATGFFFTDEESYRQKVAQVTDAFGLPVEEFEIQFIDGETLDALLFDALNIHQGNFPAFFEGIDHWDEMDKIKLILAVGQCGYSFDLREDDPSDVDIEIYEVESLRELAIEFVEEGLFGEIPDHLQHYLDYDAIARDLGMDYSETQLNGKSFIYRCG